MAKIVAMLPGGRRKVFPLASSQMILGRSETVDIPLPHETKASRQHLRITVVAGVITVEDLNSANGTWYEGESVKHRQIRARDILQIGETRLQFLYDDNAKPDPPKGKRKRNLASIDRDIIVRFDDQGGWEPVEEATPFIEMLDGEERGLRIATTLSITRSCRKHIASLDRWGTTAS